ncbi:peptidase inhibitor family I36 protein [Amycolatopsis pittospori]|uniref:peptidase inhibitor family I36 protein n=1 Tax=Amycolatopsis pittospori TaxID=2749434 RepID=UPI0015F10929|nr:peptidase inhibitor family I36 protein [Amycolatopsis pittospori]
MRKSVAAVLVTAATVAGMGFAVTPANAAGSCSSGNICLFENNDYNQGNTNHWRDFRGNVRNFNDYNWVGSNDNMDNETSSIKNRRGCTITLYQHIAWEGANSDFSNGANDGFLANNSVGDNRASSIDSWCD